MVGEEQSDAPGRASSDPRDLEGSSSAIQTTRTHINIHYPDSLLVDGAHPTGSGSPRREVPEMAHFAAEGDVSKYLRIISNLFARSVGCGIV